MNSALASSYHTVTLPSNESVTYTLRSLSSDEDISKWTEFCASIFSYKDNPPPPSYFARHFYNDPRRDLGLVRVLCTNEDEIVSSVRIFRRSLTNGTSTIEAGGIGEVCTSPNHQRRGLSKILLKDALQIMRKDNAMSCSLLHASPTFRPVYAKVGYECVTSCWSVVSVKLDQLSNDLSGPYESTCTGESVEWKVRNASFPKDTHQLCNLHKSYSEQRLITIKRSEEYWNNYVSQELGDTLWVLSKSTDSHEHIIAWMAIRKRGERYQLREFGCDKGDDFGVGLAMKCLLGVSLHQAGENLGEKKSCTSLHMPAIVLEDIREDSRPQLFLDAENAVEENDNGWMYVNFDEAKPNVLSLTKQAECKIYHLVWPTDSF